MAPEKRRTSPSHKTQLEEYLHRVGRTARCGNAGESVLFLQPCEEQYLDLLNEKLNAGNNRVVH